MQDAGANGRAGRRDGHSDGHLGATIAVQKAAIALQLVAAFRNKAIEAYQDVMRMQV